MTKITRLYEVLITLVQKDLKLKYKHSYLGYFWSIALPLAQALIFFAVFKVVIRIPIDNYPLFLITGLFMWQWLANSMSISVHVYLGNASIVKKINFERSLLPLSIVTVDMIHFLVSIPVIIIFMIYYGEKPSFIWLIGVPVLLTLQMIFVFSISLVVASLNLFFRDMERIINVMLMMWFYLTPVLYPLSMVPEKYLWIFNYNPASYLVFAWRGLFLENTLLWKPIIIFTGFSVSICLLSLSLYNKLKWRFAEVI